MSTDKWQKIAGSKKKFTQKWGQICWKSVQLVRGSSFRKDLYKIHTLVCPSNLAFWLRFCHLVSVSSNLGHLHLWIYFCPFFSSFDLFSFLAILPDFQKVFQIWPFLLWVLILVHPQPWPFYRVVSKELNHFGVIAG